MTRADLDKILDTGDTTLIAATCLTLWMALQGCEREAEDRLRDLEGA